MIKINPITYKENAPQSFEGMKLSMVFIKDSNEAKLFLLNTIDGWSIIVWAGKISDLVSEICEKAGTAVLESVKDQVKLLCMYRIGYNRTIPIQEV